MRGVEAVCLDQGLSKKSFARTLHVWLYPWSRKWRRGEFSSRDAPIVAHCRTDML